MNVQCGLYDGSALNFLAGPCFDINPMKTIDLSDTYEAKRQPLL